MPSTRFVDVEFAVSAIGNRTDANGDPVPDLSAEEMRLNNYWWMGEAGNVTPDAFKVSPTEPPTMKVLVGSGIARRDLAAMWGSVPQGTGAFLVRLEDPTVEVEIDAADATEERIDDLYLTILDDAYDGSGMGLARIVYRKGDPGEGPPALDDSLFTWNRLARITVPPLATEITADNIANVENPAAIRNSLIDPYRQHLIHRATYFADGQKGVLLTSDGEDTLYRLLPSENGSRLVMDSTTPSGLRWQSSAIPGAEDTTDGSMGTIGQWYVGLNPYPGVTFTAPASGRILVNIRAGFQAGASNNFMGCSFRVRQGSSVGSGDIHIDAANGFGFSQTVPAGHTLYNTASVPVIGLTPGATYNAYPMIYQGSSGGTCLYRAIQVIRL